MVYTGRPMPLNRTRLVEVLAVFGRLGAVAFGGPAAHVALQEAECVRRRQWLDHARFLHLLAATNLIPGPNSTEMAMHLGRLRAGMPGLVVGGAAFILPSAILVTLLAAAYTRVGTTPSVELVLATLRPAVLIVILDALFPLARSAVRSLATAAVTAGAILASFAGVGEIAIVLGAAGLGLVLGRADPARVRSVGLLELGWVCLKIGATMFGSGYVLIAYLRAELASRGWLSDQALLDAVAIGQVTPGPVSTAATFVGYLLGGIPGAIVATVALFLPGFVLVAATGPLLERWREHRTARVLLQTVSAAVVGLVAAVALRLAPVAVTSGAQAIVAAVAAILVWGLGRGSTTVIVAAAVTGVVRA